MARTGVAGLDVSKLAGLPRCLINHGIAPAIDASCGSSLWGECRGPVGVSYALSKMSDEEQAVCGVHGGQCECLRDLCTLACGEVPE
eukprot:11381260-Alexandrium_andersonii.AAC.1